MPTLTESTVVERLRRRGVLPTSADVAVTTLPGGVSSRTFLVEAGERRYVVKQPLPFLAVADEWPARQSRAGVEAAAIAALAALTPGALPSLVDYDAEAYVLTMTAAPTGWSEWRQRLLAGVVAVDAGARLGEVLGTWHARTCRDAAVLTSFGDQQGFVELRGDPYHRTVAARRPDLADPVLGCLDELLDTRTCLVHGDFSPKNVLVGADGDPTELWVLDFEVAHAGNPVFDVAFLLHHLAIKGVHLPSAAPRLRACALAFTTAYARAGGPATDEAAVLRHTGALLLARVHGKSPAAYLSESAAVEVSRLGARAVRAEVRTLADLWDLERER